MKVRFDLRNIHMGEHIANIEMEKEFFETVVVNECLNLDNGSLGKLASGAVYSIFPIGGNTHTVSALRELRRVYLRLTTEPSGRFYEFTNRMDHLAEVVGNLFKSIEYIVITSKKDLAELVHRTDHDYEFTKVKYDILGDLLASILEGEQKPEEEQPETVEKEEHVCGSGCSH